MDKKTVKNLSFLINKAYLAFFIVLFYCIARWAIGYIAPFLIAMLIAYLLQRPVNFFHRITKGKIARGVIGTVLVLLITGVIITLISILGVQITGKLREFISYLTSRFSELPILINTIKNSLLEFAEKLPESLRGTVTDTVGKISADNIMTTVSQSLTPDNILSALKTPMSSAWSTIKQLPSTIIAVLITIISASFLTADYKIIRDFILLQFSAQKRKNFMRAKHLITYSLSKIVKSYLLIILITTSELALGFGVLKLFGIYSGKYIIPLSLLIAIIDIVPVLGTGTVLIPWTIISFISGNIAMGIGLLVMYAIITVIRQIIEPKLVAGQFDLPAIVTITSMYIGTRILGPIGLFLLPITVIILKLLVDEGIITLFRTTRSVAAQEAKRTGKTTEEVLKEHEQTEEERPNAGQKLAGFISKKVSELRTADKNTGTDDGGSPDDPQADPGDKNE